MHILLSVRDRITGEYSAPMCFVNRDDAKRRIVEGYRNNPFVSDLEVYFICNFDSSVGEVSCVVPREFLWNVSDLIAEVNNA